MPVLGCSFCEFGRVLMLVKSCLRSLLCCILLIFSARYSLAFVGIVDSSVVRVSIIGLVKLHVVKASVGVHAVISRGVLDPALYEYLLTQEWTNVFSAIFIDFMSFSSTLRTRCRLVTF